MVFRSAIIAFGIYFALLLPAVAGDYQNAVYVLDKGDSIGAVRFLKSCADRGETRCEVALASFYRRGEGVAIDHAHAFDLYDRAARKGNAIAQLNLAEMYEQGIFVAADKSLAYIWYSLAAAGGKDWALRKAEGLAVNFSDAERASLKRRAKALKDAL